jgi:hypothetical protein
MRGEEPPAVVAPAAVTDDSVDPSQDAPVIGGVIEGQSVDTWTDPPDDSEGWDDGPSEDAWELTGR